MGTSAKDDALERIQGASEVEEEQPHECPGAGCTGPCSQDPELGKKNKALTQDFILELSLEPTWW